MKKFSLFFLFSSFSVFWFFGFSVFRPMADLNPRLMGLGFNPWAGWSLVFNSAHAQEITRQPSVTAVYFYSNTCQHCIKIKPFLDETEKIYGNRLDLQRHEVTADAKNQDLFQKFVKAYDIPLTRAGVPLLFIGQDYLLGDEPIANELKNKIDLCLKNSCELKVKTENNAKNGKIDLTVPLILGAAAADSINPCAIAVLLFLVSFIFGLKSSRKKLLTIGFVYIFAVFLAYYIAGLGLLKFFSFAPLTLFLRIIVPAVIIIAGLINLKDFFFGEGKISLKIPDRSKPWIEKFLTKATIPGVLIAGFLVATFELPCTGAVYVGILSLLAKEGLQLKGYFYLLFYNLIFVSPLVVILLLAVFGFNVQRMERMRQDIKLWLKFILGLAMIILGLYLIFYA